jgi:hypothetical protein
MEAAVSEDMAVQGAGSSGATWLSLSKRGRGRPRKVRGLLWEILKRGRARVGRPRGDLTRGDLVRLAFDVALYRKEKHERRNHRGEPPGLSEACRRLAKPYPCGKLYGDLDWQQLRYAYNRARRDPILWKEVRSAMSPELAEFLK